MTTGITLHSLESSICSDPGVLYLLKMWLQFDHVMTMITKAIEKQFVHEVLQDEAQRLLKNQGLAMRRLLTFHTGQTYANREAKAIQSEHMSGSLRLVVSKVVRFLDIKRRRDGSIKRKRSFHIYNKIVWGHYNHIAERLMFELTDDVRARIKAELNTTTSK